jgi:hypothetical protein
MNFSSLRKAAKRKGLLLHKILVQITKLILKVTASAIPIIA